MHCLRCQPASRQVIQTAELCSYGQHSTYFVVVSVLQGKNGQSQEMSYFLSLWAAAISKPLHPPITQGWAFAQSVHFSQWHVSLTENRIPIPLCAVTFAVTSHFFITRGNPALTVNRTLVFSWRLQNVYGLAYSHTPFGRVLEKRGGVSQADVRRMSLLVLNIAGL